MELTFLGAARSVTGSCHSLRVGGRSVLLDCGQIQGSRLDEQLNRVPLPVGHIDAVVLSHAHIDHSGRLPLLHKQGFEGPIFTHRATAELCAIMLRDAAYLHEKDAEWENKKRRRKGLAAVAPLYTREDVTAVMGQFVGLDYGERREVVPVHGEPGAQHALAAALRSAHGADVRMPARGDVVGLGAPPS